VEKYGQKILTGEVPGFPLNLRQLNNSPVTIFIVDDDNSVRRSLSLFLLSYNYNVETYSSSEEFMEREEYNGTGCIILDVNMEGKSGLQLQEELISLNSHLPIIFMTGQGNIQMSVETLKKGAVNFLEKPFKEDELLISITEAIELSKKNIEERDKVKKARALIDLLSPRELEILKYLVTGMLNKQIACELKIAEHTVKLHRHSICEKLAVKSVPEIIRIVNNAGVVPFENKY
jgi:FixJ family two-component response regulator